MNDATAPQETHGLVKIPEAADLLAVGRSTVYDLIAAGHLNTVHIGRAVRIPRSSRGSFIEQARSSSLATTEPHRIRYSTGYSANRPARGR